MRPLILLLFAALLLLANNEAQAKTSVALNTAAVPVADYTPDARQAAMRAAFDQVLLKTTGNPKVTTIVSIKNAREKADQWALSYRYITSPTAQNQLRLQVTFDQTAITQLLNSANQPTLPAERPQILLVMSKVDTSPLTVSNDDSLTQTAVDFADSYGLPVITAQTDPEKQLPDLNNEDSNATMPNITQDVLATEPALQALQQQYHADAVLNVTIIKPEANAWSATWQLWNENKLTQWTDKNNNINLLIKIGIDRVANQLLAQSTELQPVTAASLSTTTVQMAITGITDLTSFDQALKYIKGLSKVQDVQVTDTGNDSLLLQVTVEGEQDNFINALNNSSQLVKLPSKTTNQILYYHWLGPQNMPSSNTTAPNSDPLENPAPLPPIENAPPTPSP